MTASVHTPNGFDLPKDMTDFTEKVVLLCLEPKKKGEAE
jgi:hypothetical protein